MFARSGGALSLWPGVLATWGPGGESELHAHHAWHLVVALSGGLKVSGMEAAARSAPAVITRPDVRHAIGAVGRQVVIVFVDPESEAGAGLSARYPEGISLVDVGTADAVRAALGSACSPEEAGSAAARALEALGVTPRRGSLDPRLGKLLDHLSEAPPEADQSLETLARIVGLSSSRFLHVFTAEVGIPLRPYLRWLRLQRAGGAIAAGMALSEAAYAAGFSDASHLTRTFREMFGTTPSEILKRQGSRPKSTAHGQSPT